MKRIGFLMLSLCILLFACTACGKEEEEVYYDIEEISEQLFNNTTLTGDASGNFLCAGTQFHEGEPVQLWVERVTDENRQTALNLYLRKADGSMEMMLEGLDKKYRVTGWYLAEDGNFYIPQSNGVVKMDGSGKVIYENTEVTSVGDICELKDGSILLAVFENGVKKIARMDPGTGEITKLENLLLGENSFSLGAGEKGLYLLDNRGLWLVNLQEQTKEKLISFAGMTYSVSAQNASSVSDFRVQEGDRIQVLRADGIRENLKLVDVGKDRTVLKIRMADSLALAWFFNRVVEFNQKSDKYYVVVDQCSEEDDVWDFRSMTGVQIATGKGADIIMGSAVLGDIQSFLDKGAFEDLKPYMEQSGIREDDYFPMAFDCWRDGDKVYGVQPLIFVNGGFAMEDFLFGDDPDMEEVLDALFAYEEKAILTRYFTSDMLLEYFLQGSENFWGMIDWEKGDCNFDGELFRKILEVAKRYGNKGEKDVEELAVMRSASNLYSLDMREELEEEGKLVLDFFFDDGCHARVENNFVMAVNAGSKNKEGAWEFLSFLLGEEAQAEVKYNEHYPASRAAFLAMAEKEMEEGALKESVRSDGRVSRSVMGCSAQEQRAYLEQGLTLEEIAELCRVTQERVDEIIATIEQAKPFPVKVEPILDIICEEAQYYFNGVKSAEEVISIMENRVQLYLKEHT